MGILSKLTTVGGSQLPHQQTRWFQYQVPRPKNYSETELGCQGDQIVVDSFSADAPAIFRQAGTSLWQERTWAAGNYVGITQNNTWSNPSGTSAKQAYAKAYAQFIKKAFDQAEWATSLAERRKSLSMMTTRLVQFHRALAALRKGRFKKFLQVLGVKARWKDRSRAWARPKDASSLWLEYWFGWAPLINDIYVGLEGMCEVIPDTKLHGVGTGTWSETSNYTSGPSWATNAEKGKVRCRISGCVSVIDQTVHDRNKLGLLNPARTALDLIPFSWLLNWFVNVQQYVSSFTDLAGLRLSRATVSFKTVWERVYSSSLSGNWGSSSRTYHRWVYGRKPVTNLPIPRLVVRFSGLNPTRAATAVALIINLLAPSRKDKWQAYYYQ